MKLSRPTIIAAAIAVPVVGVGSWTVMTSYRQAPEKPPPLLGATARPVERAAVACKDIAEVQRLVGRNADRDSVLAYLSVAQQEIALAAQGDPLWLSLQSGIESINKGLRQDEEPASELGIAIARDQCRRAGIYLEGSVHPSP